MRDPRVDGLEGEIQHHQHAVQSAVKFLLTIQKHGDMSECSPKHLRVGVNSALIDSSAVAKVLIDKGIISEVEYFTAVRDLWRNEHALYRDRARALTGDQRLDFE
jgi:hypothetical protein